MYITNSADNARGDNVRACAFQIVEAFFIPELWQQTVDTIMGYIYTYKRQTTMYINDTFF
jgi:hypothetical protein